MGPARRGEDGLPCRLRGRWRSARLSLLRGTDGPDGHSGIRDIRVQETLAEAIGKSLDKCIRPLMRGAPSFADHVRDGSRRLASVMPAFCVPAPMS